MDTIITYYVNELVLDGFVSSCIFQIKSVEDYLMEVKDTSNLIGLRFFQTESVVIHGKNFTSDPEYISGWIRADDNHDFNIVHGNNMEIDFTNSIKLDEYQKLILPKNYTSIRNSINTKARVI